MEERLRNRNAFTLIELLVVVTILVILAAIAVPLYTGFIDEGRRAEARGALAAILTAQQRYYRDPGNGGQYANNLAALEIDLTDAQVHWAFTLPAADENGFTGLASGTGTDYTGLCVELVYSRTTGATWTTDCP